MFVYEPRKKMTSNVELINDIIAQTNTRITEAANAEKNADSYRTKAIAESTAAIEKGMARTAKIQERTKFLEDAQILMVSEALYKLLTESQGVHFENDGDESIKRALINEFVREQGVKTLLRRFSETSGLLNEMADTINDSYAKVLEAADNGSYTIDNAVTDDFFNTLNIVDAGEATATIQMRVTSALNDFIETNAQTKAEIEEVLKAAKDQAELAKTDVAKESCNIMAKRKINEIRTARPQRPFGCMVQNFAEAVMATPAMHDEYMNEGKLDMDKIVDRTRLVYTFAEMVNTLKLTKVDGNYVAELIESMKA